MTTYTLFGQPGTAGTVDSYTGPVNNGVKFSVSSDCTFTGIWYYSAAGCTALPSDVGLYNFDTSALIFSDSSPSWSGAAGSGWVKYTPSTGHALTSGVNYMAAAGYNSNDGNEFYSITANYWTGTGVTNGPLTCVDSPDYFDVSGSFAEPTTAYGPYNIWVDVEVTTSSSVSGTSDITLKKMTVSSSGNVIASGSAAVTFKKMTIAVSGAEKDSGTVSVALKKMTVSATASVVVSGIADITLKKMSASVSGAEKDSGTVSVTLKKMTVSVTAKAPFSGTADVMLKKMTVDVSASAKVAGTVSVMVKKIEVRSVNIPPVNASSLFIFSMR